MPELAPVIHTHRQVMKFAAVLLLPIAIGAWRYNPVNGCKSREEALETSFALGGDKADATRFRIGDRLMLNRFVEIRQISAGEVSDLSRYEPRNSKVSSLPPWPCSGIFSPGATSMIRKSPREPGESGSRTCRTPGAKRFQASDFEAVADDAR